MAQHSPFRRSLTDPSIDRNFSTEVEPDIQRRLMQRLAVAKLPLLRREGAVGVPVGFGGNVSGAALAQRAQRQGQVAEGLGSILAQEQGGAGIERQQAFASVLSRIERENEARRRANALGISGATGLGTTLGIGLLDAIIGAQRAKGK